VAWFSEHSIFPFGKYKGKKVCEVNDAEYINWLHHNTLNVYFMPDTLDRLGIENKGKKPHQNIKK
jgi:uncharacterized protein (DUF3820 family)